MPKENTPFAAHESNWSAHLERNKTFNRLIEHFYWNKIRTDVSYFCNTCHVCQLLGKAKIPPKAPLIKVAMEDEPFRRIGVVLCGPLPACNETITGSYLQQLTHVPVFQ